MRSVIGSRRSSVAIMSAAMFPVLIGLAGMVVEYGNGIAMKAKLQQIADSAAYGGAIAYTETSSTTTMNSAVSRIATLNGIATSAASASLVNSPSGDGNQAVRVTVTGTAPLSLARIWGGSDQLAVEAMSYAEVKSTSKACVIALSHAGSGVALSGGTALSAASCAVESNSTVTAPYGTSITTPTVTYNSSTALVIYPGTGNTPNGQHIVAPAGKTLSVTKTAASDPLSGNTSVTGEVAHIQTLALMSAPTSPTAPSAPSAGSGSSVSLGYNPTSATVGGCPATMANNTWTIRCSGAGPFYFGTISLGGGLSLVLTNSNGSVTPTYDFNGDINASSGSSWTFPAGTYNVSGGLVVSGGVTVSFGAGTFNFGTSSNCSGYSICNSGSSLSFAGPSTFSLAGGLYNSQPLTMNATSMALGKSSASCNGAGSGYSICNSSTLTITGPTTYSLAGSLYNSSTMSINATTLSVGNSGTACNNSAGYSICNTGGGTLTVAGPTSFALAGGIYTAGGSVLTLGTTAIGSTSPTTNSFSIGSANNGDSLTMGGGAKATFADATGSGDVFQMTGNIDVLSGGGSCLVVSAAAAHDINGYIASAGGTYLGSGTYSVADYVALGDGGGGDVTCMLNGVSQSVGVSGTGVTLGIGAASTLGSGHTCANTAFCVGAGYGHVSLTAPSSGGNEGLAIIGPTSSTNTAGALFTEGSSGTSISGALYVPNGAITLSGGASVGNGSGQCLEVIGSQVTMQGGAVLASSCAGIGGGTGTAIVLVQ